MGLEKGSGRVGEVGKAIILATALAGLAGCCGPNSSKTASSVNKAVTRCLYTNVPGFSAKICDPAYSEALLQDFSKNCPGVGNLDEVLNGKPLMTVAGVVRATFNDQCKQVLQSKEDDSGDDGLLIVPIFMP
ncbi:MAG: hypothetical protein PHP74_02405 [Candidatus Gracilibacteria bacterium]|nr:hypothetical protein [Candidatus Gracilibacteria bacterium]